jgi:type IV pilus assembly protein PilB
LSTLHTNNAPETLARLLDMGISPYHLATSLSLIIAQRLLRRLCDDCKTPLHLPRNILIQEGFSLKTLDHVRLFTPSGCSKCHSGYRGRIGIYEVVAITEAFSRVIMSGGNSMQIAELAQKSGFNSLRESALEKAAQGLTSLAEVNRMT